MLQVKGAIPTNNEGLIPKLGLGWEEYIIKVVKIFNRRVKSSELIEYIVRANGSLFDRERVQDVVRGTCSKFGSNGTSIVERGVAKSEGYYYSINPEKSMVVAA